LFFFRRPSDDRLHEFIATATDQPFSYRDVGGSQTPSRKGGGALGAPSRKGGDYNVDHNRVCLGSGSATFARAQQAVREWKMFEMPWINLCWPNAPIEPDTTVAVLVSHLGFWSLNAARIVYVIDEPRRFGFAYGTLIDHAESGEERFSVEFLEDGSVWYDLYAFSRPKTLARICYPIARHLQRKFARDSLAAMRRAAF
jgi:uncharacterized protein (UPF0548 family)